MKTIFLCEKESQFRRVYSDGIIRRLGELTQLDGRIYKKSELLESTKKFSEVETIFSTWSMPVLSEEEIRGCLPRLRCLYYAAGSVQTFARPFLNRGVRVFSAWAANAVPVAEYAAAQILLANKGFFAAAPLASAGKYKEAQQKSVCFPGNYHTKIGIIGAGMIGKLLIGILKRHDLDLVVYDPFLPDSAAKALGVEKVSLDTLFRECAVVSNHLANNEGTRGMLGAALFSSMPPYSTFLNTGRGAQVVEGDLIRVLKERPDLTAILDVTDPEPPAGDSDFYALPNCILTPHIAGSSGGECHRMAEFMLTEFENHQQNRASRYEVTSEMLETMA